MTSTLHLKKILIFNPAFLGDTVLTTPLIRAVKNIFPNSHITFSTRPEHITLYEDINLIDALLPYDKRGRFRGLRGTILFSKVIKAQNFDLIINLHRSFRSSLLFLLSKPKFLIGFKSAKLSFLFTKSIYRDPLLHEVERNLSLLQLIVDNYSLGEAKIIAGAPFTRIDQSLLNKINSYSSKISRNGKTIGIAIGSVWTTKRYPAEYYAKLAESLYILGYNIALFGSFSDSDDYNIFFKYYRYPYIDYLYKLDIRELPTFIASVDLFICNDSGPLHIAVSVGKIVVAIFGSTVPAQGFYPYDSISHVVEEKSLSCRPCSSHGRMICPKAHFKCMRDINYKIIKNIIIKILSENK